MLDYFSDHFARVGIVESYGMLGDQPSVYHGHAWTHAIGARIGASKDPFLQVFRRLVDYWNMYLLKAQLPDVKKDVESLSVALGQDSSFRRQISAGYSALEGLIEDWDEDAFADLYANMLQMAEQIVARDPSPQVRSSLEKVQQGIKFVNLVKPGSGLQFTLADVGLALALIDHDAIFTTSPVDITVSEKGFLTTRKSPMPNVFYYDKVEKKEFAKILLDSLRSLESPKGITECLDLEVPFIR